MTEYIERARRPIDATIPVSANLTRLLTAVETQYRRKPRTMQFRVSAAFRRAYLAYARRQMNEMNPGSGDVMFKYAQQHHSLTYGGINIVVDDTLRGEIAIDEPASCPTTPATV